jgi:hypothetical protein
MEFDEQHRLFGEAELRIGIDRPHVQLVQKLDPGDRNAGLDG